MNRRDVFKLMGLATAATFATRFPMLPRAEPTPLMSGELGRYEGFRIVEREIAKPPAFGHLEMGLMRDGMHEVRSRDYVRVVPQLMQDGPADPIRISGVFPTVTRRGYTARGMGLFEPDGPLLFYRPFDHGRVVLYRGDNIVANFELTLDGDNSGKLISAERLAELLRLIRFGESSAA